VPGNASTKCDHANLSFTDDRRFCLTTPEPGRFLTDEAAANLISARLGEAISNWETTSQPYFVGLGTHKPHLTWTYPRRFFDASPDGVAEAAHQAWPADVPHLAWHECAEMSHPYWDSTGWGVPPSVADFSGHQSLMRRAYYGCLAYTDSLIGQVMDTLDKHPAAAAHTVTVFMGDHGWHLGEHDLWCKMTNRETGTRVPLMIRAPWIDSSKGKVAKGLAEAVDLFPTLAQLAGVPIPTGKAGAHLGGVSLVPLLIDPAHGRVKDVALSQFPRCFQNNTHHTGGKPGDENNHTSSWETMSDCHWTERGFIDFMGYKMRTDNMSFTLWLAWDGANLRPDWDRQAGVELYDHMGDVGMAPAAFDDYENVNLAGKPEYAQLQATLLARLRTEVERWIV
jgi:iduronate 2-sulfatase